MTKLTYTALVIAAILSISVSVIFANQINATAAEWIHHCF
jgi:hypothetical protein